MFKDLYCYKISHLSRKIHTDNDYAENLQTFYEQINNTRINKIIDHSTTLLLKGFYVAHLILGPSSW